jgi:hypothetical protein
VNVKVEIPRPQPSTPNLHFPSIGKHEGLLKPPKNDTKDNRRKSVNKPKAIATEIPDFADFESNGDEAALHFQQPRYALFVCFSESQSNIGREYQYEDRLTEFYFGRIISLTGCQLFSGKALLCDLLVRCPCS